MKVEKMSSTPECVTKTPEIEDRKKEAREKLAAIFSDAEKRGDNSKVNPELRKTAIDIENTSRITTGNGAVDLCNKALGSYGKSLDYINKSPIEAVQAIGESLQSFRKDKTEKGCK